MVSTRRSVAQVFFSPQWPLRDLSIIFIPEKEKERGMKGDRERERQRERDREKDRETERQREKGSVREKE